jgi:hypothetical protein
VASCGSLTLDRSEVGRGLLSIDGITLSHNESQGERSPNRRYLYQGLGRLRRSGRRYFASILLRRRHVTWTMSPTQTVRKLPCRCCFSNLSALRERCSATCQRRRTPVPTGLLADGLQITTVTRGRSENQRPEGRADGSFLCANWQSASGGYGLPSAGHDGSCSDWNCATSDHMSSPIST